VARLPQPGGDSGNWGAILNDFLSQSLTTDGTLKNNVVAESHLTSAVQTKLNAGASPNWSAITSKPAVIAAGATQTAARQTIGAAASKTFYVNDYGADPTGATASDAAIAAAIAALGTGMGIIEFGTGIYQINSSQVLAHAGQYFKGQGLDITIIDFRGTGPALKCWDSTVPTDGMSAPGHGGGVLGGMTIDGINNTNAGSIGLQIGDILSPLVENVRIASFINSGSIGFLGQNRYSWTEYGNLHILSQFNTNCFVFESHPSHPLPYGGKSSWSYNSFNLGFNAEANQNGVILRNNVDLTGVHWNMNFNCNPGPTNTGVAITVGINSSDKSGIEGYLSWQGECTNTGAVGHKDINVGAVAALRGYGALVFHDYAPTATFIAGSAVPYRVVFSGRVNSPSLGHYAVAEVPFVTIGDPGRFGALGDDANYIDFIEGDSGSWPALNARGPSTDIGIQINTKGWGQLQYNGAPVAIAATSAPTAWNSPGKTGQTVSDGTYFYVCITDNVWKKILLQDM
jgi:hypothetical protein